MLINPELLALAEWRVANPEGNPKEAFVPPDPAAGGGGAPPGAPPGMDPSAMGGAPPGMDPAAMGGAPPGVDPAAMGGAPDPMSAVMQQLQAMQQQIQQLQGGGAAAQPGAAGAGGKPMKADINTVAMDCYQTKKLLVGMYQRMGWELPPDILDGPNRDPSTGASMAPGAPGSTSDPARPADAGQGGQASPNAISPVQPVAPASLSAPPDQGATKAGADADLLHMGRPQSDTVRTLADVGNRADAVASLLQVIRSRS